MSAHFWYGFVCVGLGAIASPILFVLIAQALRRADDRVLAALRTMTWDGRWVFGRDLVRDGAAGRHTVYPILARLEEQGLIESLAVEPPAGRRMYRVKVKR